MNGKAIFSILLSATLFLNGIIPTMPSASSETPHRGRMQEPSPAGIRVGSLDLFRGEAGSFTEGPLFDQARAALRANFPGVSFSSSPTLTAEFLATIDILIISSLASVAETLIEPLSNQEQVALYQFVLRGGFVIALLSQAADETVNRSIAGPFGVECEGLAQSVTSVVEAPRSSPITYGRFGTVSEFSQHAAGGMTTLGPAVSLATNSLGSSLAVVYPEKLGPGSGAVVFLSSTHSFLDDGELAGGGFSTNEALFLNMIDFFAQRLRLRPVRIDFDRLPNGMPLTGGTLITDQYAGLGVIFSSSDPQSPGLLTLDAGARAVSAPNVAQAGKKPKTEFTATFIDPATGEPGVTDFMALTPAGGLADAHQELMALDLDGHVIARVKVDFSRSQPVELRTPRRIIHQVKLTTSGPIDNFTFAQVTQPLVCVGFDELPDGTAVRSGTRITDAYQSLGVIFSSDDPRVRGLIAIRAPQLAISPPNVAEAGSRLGFEMTATFVDPETKNPAVTDFVSITTNRDRFGELETFIAFDLEGNVVAATIVDFSQVGQVVELRTPTPVIHEVRLVTSDFIDDFCFAPVRTAEDTTPPTVSVLVPNGDETIIGGRMFTIRWMSSDDVDVTSQDVVLSTDGGATFPTTIAADLPGDAQSFEWTVPSPLDTTQGRIQVIARDAAGNVGQDQSDADFTVRPAPQIQSISPSSGTQGATVEATITGENLEGASSVSFSGTGVTASIKDGATATSIPITITIASDAAIGPRTFSVTTARGPAQSGSVRFLVLVQQDFSISGAPSTGQVVQGDSTTFAITAQAVGEFTSLISLSVSGLPQGVRAEFDRPMIAPGGLVYLTVSMTASVLAGAMSFDVLGTAEIAGSRVARQSRLNLNVISTGITTVSGRVLTADDMPMPLPGVRVELIVDKQTGRTNPTIATRTDAAGNFVLQNVPEGDQTFLFDGSTATVQGKRYPPVEESIHVDANQPNRLNFIVHLPAIDEQHIMPVQNNAPMEQMLSTPAIPNLQLMVPARTEIRAPDGSMVTQISLTPVVTDRAPGPLPEGVVVPMLFSIQPGRAEPSQPIPIFFPNFTNASPGTKADLYTFDVTEGRFVKYGTGTVSPDGRQVMPDIDPATGRPYGIPRFSWHFPAPPPPRCLCRPCAQRAGDPVNLGNGSFLLEKTDLEITGPTPISLKRVYSSLSNAPGPFGLGAAEGNYSHLLTAEGNTLLLTVPPEGQFRFSPVSGKPDQFENTTEPALQGAVLRRVPGPFNFELRLRDGLRLRFDRVPTFANAASLSAIIDRNNNTVTLTRIFPRPGQLGLLTEITDSSGRKIMLTYDDNGRVISATDLIGRTVRYSYDSKGRLTSVVNPAGGQTRYSYDDQDRMISAVDPRGIRFFANRYDAEGRVVEQTQADGATIRFSYKVTGELITESLVADGRGNSTKIRFNCMGHSIGVTDALGQTTIVEREMISNRVRAVVSPIGQRTSFTYDERGNRNSIIDPAGNATRFVYEPTFNFPVKIINALQQETDLEYDERGNLISVTNPLGSKATIQYNSSGQPTSVTDPLGSTTSFEYDSASNLIAIIDPLRGRITIGYDAVARMLSVTSPQGLKARLIYDALNNITEFIDENGERTSFGYDQNSNLTSVTDARGNIVAFTYDQNDFIASRIDGVGSTETYQYDQTFNLVRVTDRRGFVTQYGYDALNQLVRAQYNDGDAVVYHYDSVGRLVRADDSLSGSVEINYDALSQVTSVVTSQGSIRYVYDALGRRTQMMMNQESPITYQYDGASRLASVRQGAEEFTFNYDVLGQLTRLTQPNGISTEYAYDAVSRLTQLESSRDGQSLIDFRFEYDPLDRIASIRSQEIAPLLPEAATVELADSANRYAIFNGDRLEWDAHGNLTRLTDQSGHSTLYTWDARNRLTNISGPGIEARFLYNVFDQRIRQEVNGVEREYLYDFHDIVQETGSQGVASYLRTLGVDEPLRRQNEDGMASYYLTDHLGSTVALADSAGMITTRYLYEPFGHTMVVGAPTTNPFRFTGREDDGPTGLYYYRARYYSPKLQRFISEDPLDLFGGGLNFYTYAGNDPVNLTDPSGLVPVPVILCGVGGLIGFVTGGIGSAISQFISGGFSFDCFNARDALASAAGSAVAGCLSAIPFIGQLGGGFVGGALSNAIGGVVTRTLDSQEGNVLSVKDVFQDLTFGAAGNIAATRAQRALQGSSQFRNLGREVDRLGRLTRNGTVGRQARINAFNEAARRHRIILEKAVQVAGGRITNAGLPVLGTLVGEGATAAGQRLYGRGRP